MKYGECSCAHVCVCVCVCVCVFVCGTFNYKVIENYKT